MNTDGANEHKRGGACAFGVTGVYEAHNMSHTHAICYPRKEPALTGGVKRKWIHSTAGKDVDLCNHIEFCFGELGETQPFNSPSYPR